MKPNPGAFAEEIMAGHGWTLDSVTAADFKKKKKNFSNSFRQYNERLNLDIIAHVDNGVFASNDYNMVATDEARTAIRSAFALTGTQVLTPEHLRTFAARVSTRHSNSQTYLWKLRLLDGLSVETLAPHFGQDLGAFLSTTVIIC